MNTSFIAKQLRRTNRNLVVFNSCICISILLYAFAQWKYLYNFAAGPFAISQRELATIQPKPSSLWEYVTVTGDDITNTNLEDVYVITNKYTRKKTTGKPAFEYRLLRLQDTLLVVKSPYRDPQSTRVTGYITDLPATVKHHLTDNTGFTDDRLSAAILPVMLNTNSYVLDGWIAIGLLCPLWVLASWNISKGIRRVSRPDTHPLLVSLAQYGAIADIDLSITGEMEKDVDSFKGAGFMWRWIFPARFKLTKSWVIRLGMFGVEADRQDDLRWVYVEVTSNLQRGKVTSTEHHVVAHMRGHRTTKWDVLRSEVLRFMEALQSRYPWVLYGHTWEAEAMWDTNAEMFDAVVAERKASFLRDQSLS